MKVTIKEVAKAAGVSIGTVSRVLNGKDRVSQATRIKVKAAIESLDFKPDLTARTMIHKHTQSIGLVVPALTNEYWSALAEHVQEAAWDKGYTLLLCTAGYQLEKHLSCIQTLNDRKVDGIIAGIRLHDPMDQRQLSLTRFPDVKMVSLVQELPNTLLIGVDQYVSSVRAVEHLIGLGHRSIAYVGFGSDREHGYRHALEAHGIDVVENQIYRGDGSFQSGYNAVMQWHKHGTAFTAIFCWNDMTAMGALQAVEALGLRVPEDIALVGYDDIPMAKLVKPALTTVHQPLKDIGRTAVHRLLDLINGVELAPVSKVLFDAELVIRDSCGGQLKPTT
jgi:LacI family transcriptional regulator